MASERPVAERWSVGSLFSGIGGFDLGLERAGFTVKWQVENNDYCRKVLKKHWPKVPCHYDIKDIDWRGIPGVDVVCGGFPCQPFSIAGKRRGQEDDRYLWPEVVRCLDTLRPTWFLGENVPGLINLALDQVCTDLESLGYTVWPVCVPACAVDAPHQRQRVWIVAHNHTEWESQSKGTEQNQRGRTRNGSEDVADANHERLPQSESESCQEWTSRASVRPCTPSEGWWTTEPELGRVAHGISNRVDRLRGLGNAVVPQIVEAIGRVIVQMESAGLCR
jgi:DNA (cytosine-5)-methyltransferase 1